MKKYSTLLAAITLLLTTAQAQYRTNYKSVADRFYAKGDYYSAASYYEKYLSGTSPVYTGYAPYQVQKQGTHLNNTNKMPAEVMYKLADSYYRLNYFSQAEPWYKILMDKHAEQYPQSLVSYAVCLRAKGDHMAALQQLEKCMLTYRVYDRYAEQVHHELDICLFIRRQLTHNTTAIKVRKLGNAAQETGVVYSPDGTRMYYTASAGKIYCKEKKGEGWSQPVMVMDNARQPQLSPDGKYLLFASNRAGGLGGYDIWYAALDNNGKAGEAINMGATINTAADEEAPFYHAGSNTLVFASKGRIGMGGFDLFTATGTIGDTFKEAVNMGYPVNSVKDDSWFISKGVGLLEDALISSDRFSTCCLELLSVHKANEQQGLAER